MKDSSWDDAEGAGVSVTSMPRSTPEAQGVAAEALLAFVDAAEREIEELHSFMVLRHGQVIAEGWWAPYVSSRPHMMYSLSKSFTSTAVGLAVGEGRLSVDDPVVRFFPDDVPAVTSDNLGAMRVRHLLSMTTGHIEDTLGFLWEGNAPNWVSAFLKQPVAKEPGTHFVYNSGASYVLSAIVQSVTGQTLMEYLTPRLFEPIGIVGAKWDTCPRGINTGGWGLHLKTEDIARFGTLYLQDGVWGGTRLLPAGWVREATAMQVPNGDNPDSDWAQGYGYQFWRSRHSAYRGDGACGQFCVVMPEQDVVVAITAGVKDMQGALNLLWERLLPAFGPAALPANPSGDARLLGRLASLRLAGVRGRKTEAIVQEISGRTYRFSEALGGVESATLYLGDREAILQIRSGRETHRIVCGLEGVWATGITTIETPGFPLPNLHPMQIAATGAWIDEQTFVAKISFVETPFSPTISWRFEGQRLLLDFRCHAAFGLAEWPQMVGVHGGGMK